MTSESERNTVDDPEDLIPTLQARDPAAIATLYDLLGRRTFGLAYRVLRDATAAEDVVLDAFLSIWQQPELFGSPGARIEPLLLAITYRKAIDTLRAGRRETPRVWPPALLPVDGPPQPVEAADLSHLRTAVKKAIDNLPRDQRDVLEAAYYRGRNVAEIGAALEISPKKVKADLNHALQSVGEAAR